MACYICGNAAEFMRGAIPGCSRCMRPPEAEPKPTPPMPKPFEFNWEIERTLPDISTDMAHRGTYNRNLEFGLKYSMGSPITVGLFKYSESK